MSKARVLLADDHQLVAEGLRGLLEPEYELVGIAADGRELLATAAALRPDVIIMDITMPALNGIEAARQLRRVGSSAKVVFLTMHREPAYAARALEAGAAGFMLKHSAAAELLTAIREVLHGRTYISPLIAGELLQSYRDAGGQPENPFDRLTPRQKEVLQLIAEGQSAKHIGKTLQISPRTAEFHKARLLHVLGLETTADLVQYAIRHGLTPG